MTLVPQPDRMLGFNSNLALKAKSSVVIRPGESHLAGDMLPEDMEIGESSWFVLSIPQQEEGGLLVRVFHDASQGRLSPKPTCARTGVFPCRGPLSLSQYGVVA